MNAVPSFDIKAVPKAELHVNENFIRSANALGLTVEEQLTLADNSLKAAFMDEERRRTYRRTLTELRWAELAVASSNAN